MVYAKYDGNLLTAVLSYSQKTFLV